jgi:hypothetical protein
VLLSMASKLPFDIESASMRNVEDYLLTIASSDGKPSIDNEDLVGGPPCFNCYLAFYGCRTKRSDVPHTPDSTVPPGKANEKGSFINVRTTFEPREPIEEGKLRLI